MDRDLAVLYGVKTKVLKQAVRRNFSRFPEDFMFEMTKDEFIDWTSQFVTSNRDKIGLRYLPFCFTEMGVAMLSSVLKSDRAIEMNMHIMRVYNRMRELILSHKDLLLKMEVLEKRVGGHDEKIRDIFKYLKQFITVHKEPRKKIGF